MVHARKPVEVIAEELWDVPFPGETAEDIIDVLEREGWRLVFVPDTESVGVLD
jgi:hypothetical protein